ncbi:hypothetical protein [Lysinibacillus irui]|uniref:Uncharacterized protein n=1 Tax=Lysinibacillus irui TaxID=2998077 RepID=A0AAJ5UWG3_9BACI|nr:hypothetical protein [Lysinibacillus irui]WDV09373.1 hypothetical protein OU989_22920 [Lysinibacillus irui]
MVLEQFSLFDEEIYNKPTEKSNKKSIPIPEHEANLLNNHVLPLLQENGIKNEELKVCVRDVNESWMVIEAATKDICVTMTIWNNGNKDYIHYKSNIITEAYVKQYFTNRTKPSQIYYLEKMLERNTIKFLSK